MKVIILNSTNVISDNYNNTLKYNFPSGGVDLSGCEIALAGIEIYYSWFNISGNEYNNNFLSYTWFDNVGRSFGSPYIPDGFYTIDQLNSYIQYIMLKNSFYMIDSITGNPVYFLEIVSNPQSYAIQLNCYPLSTAIATTNNWVLPSSATWSVPVSVQTPSFTIPSNNMQSLLGIKAGTYPPTLQTAKYSALSTSCPQVSPVNSLVVYCSLVSSPYSSPSNVVYAFSPNNTSFGSIISSKPPNMIFCDVVNGKSYDFTVRILDQNGKNVKIIDNSIVITLVIKEKDKK